MKKPEISRLDVAQVDWKGMEELVKLSLVAGHQAHGSRFEDVLVNSLLKVWDVVDGMPRYQAVLICASLLAAFAEGVQRSEKVLVN